jgi:hypothetical protein
MIRLSFRLNEKPMSELNNGAVPLPLRVRSMLLASSMPLPNGSGDKCYGTVLVS